MNTVADKGKPYVAGWLYSVAFLIFCMIMLGGLTRLTNSGLSMVDWKPIMGAIPPLDQEDWQAVFARYQQYPEYIQHNYHITLEDFKFIFLMEYAHRMLGRLIGLVFFFPFLFFLFKRWLKPPMVRYCLLLFFLGGLQGVVGWYMVKSGLVDIPRVSHFRLTLHLSMAILVFTMCLWTAFGLSFQRQDMERPAGIMASLIALWGLISVQIGSGGFVAGLKAGFSFNTFPTMNGMWMPPSVWSLEPWYTNFIHNPVMIQFTHRVLALVVTIAVVVFYVRFLPRLHHPRLRLAMHLILVALVIQVTLGISTLVLRVPTSLASLHQGGALFLWTTITFLCHQLTASPQAVLSTQGGTYGSTHRNRTVGNSPEHGHLATRSGGGRP